MEFHLSLASMAQRKAHANKWLSQVVSGDMAQTVQQRDFGQRALTVLPALAKAPNDHLASSRSFLDIFICNVQISSTTLSPDEPLFLPSVCFIEIISYCEQRVEDEQDYVSVVA